MNIQPSRRVGRRCLIAGGSNLTDVHALNRRTLFDISRLNGPISRGRDRRILVGRRSAPENLLLRLLRAASGWRRGGGRNRRAGPLRLRWLDSTAEHLAPVLATLDCLFDPEAIIFGERLPDVLLYDLFDRLGTRMPAFAVRYKPFPVRLLRGSVGDDAAAEGAATLPLYGALNPDVFVIEAMGSREKGGELPTIP